MLKLKAGCVFTLPCNTPDVALLVCFFGEREILCVIFLVECLFSVSRGKQASSVLCFYRDLYYSRIGLVVITLHYSHRVFVSIVVVFA